MTRSAPALGRLRETRPLVHQITNYVVMNETANATLAVGALPVMAHAREEVEQMAAAAGALVLNIGTLSPPWVEAMLLAGQRGERRRRAGRARPGRRRGDRLPHRDGEAHLADELELAVVRGNAAEIATLAGRRAEIRGVESIAGGEDAAELARAAARAWAPSPPSPARSTTSPTASGSSRSQTAIRCSHRSPARAACRPPSPAVSSPSSDSAVRRGCRCTGRVRRGGGRCSP